MLIGGAYGIFEGRTASLLHPLTMASLFLVSLYSGYLGLQWRTLRTIGDDIKQLNSQLPSLSSSSDKVKYPIADVITSLESKAAALQSEEESNQLKLITNDITLLKSSTVQDINNQIENLSENRKTLSKGKY